MHIYEIRKRSKQLAEKVKRFDKSNKRIISITSTRFAKIHLTATKVQSHCNKEWGVRGHENERRVNIYNRMPLSSPAPFFSSSTVLLQQVYTHIHYLSESSKLSISWLQIETFPFIFISAKYFLAFASVVRFEGCDVRLLQLLPFVFHNLSSWWTKTASLPRQNSIGLNQKKFHRTQQVWMNIKNERGCACDKGKTEKERER